MAFAQPIGAAVVKALAGGVVGNDRAALLIDGGMDLGGAPAARAPDGLRFAPLTASRRTVRLDIKDLARAAKYAQTWRVESADYPE